MGPLPKTFMWQQNQYKSASLMEKKIVLTHICDVDIPGLPHKLIGHIVLNMKMASLLGIHILCKAGCKDIFDDDKC
jgi:hypothetical protein